MTARQYEPVPPPAFATVPASPADVLGGIERWVASPPLRDLVAAFGGSVPAGDVGGALRWLADFSAEHWDYRRGAERNARADEALSGDAAEVVQAAAQAFGMFDEAVPRRRHYDHFVILGGLLRGCITRARRAAEVLSGGLGAGSFAAVGGFRPLNDAELRLAAEIDFEPGGDEFSAMDAAVREAFSVDGPTGERGEGDGFAAWLVRDYETAGGMPLRVVATPSSQPATRRANTADNFSFWATEVGRPSAGESVLVLTTSRYVPYQHCEAVRALVLPYGVSVETIGVDPTRMTGPLRLPLRLTDYVQEIRATIGSLVALYEAVTA